MRRFEKYKQNLSVVNHDGQDWIQSYRTRVAKIDYGTRTANVVGYWSMTTTKHVNYACKELGLQPNHVWREKK
jgi:hypothetical protein